MSSSAARQPTAFSSCWALAVLFLTNVFNQGDRMLFGVVADPIRRELQLSDTELSLASGLFFVLFNLIGGLFIARFIDRGNRVRILALGVVVWSMATAATGLAHDFPQLTLARIMVGIGEATAFPAAMSLIPDLFRLGARGRAVSIYQSSSFVGIVGGTVIAGILAASMGWRSMFMVCGLAGIGVAMLLLFTVAEPPRDASSANPQRLAYWDDFTTGAWRIVTQPGFWPLSIGLGFALMMGAVLGAWGPAFLLRSHQVPLAQVGLVIGPPVGLGGIVGTIASGFLADWIIRRRGRRADMLLIPLVAVPLSLPFMVGFIFTPVLGTAMICAAAMNVLLSAAVPPTMNYAINAAAPSDRGLTSTVVLIVMGLVGGALGPFVVGSLSDHLSADLGGEALRYSLSSMLVTPIVATLLLAVTFRSTAKVSAVEPG